MKMTERTFKKATDQLRISEANIEIARLFFIDGLSTEEIITQHKMTKQNLSRIIKLVNKGYEKLLKLSGVTTVTVQVLNEDLAALGGLEKKAVKVLEE